MSTTDLDNGLSRSFRADGNLVQAFVDFSGDRSSLHTNLEYGRRARYGSNVIHGMLPVTLLPLVLAPWAQGAAWNIKQVSARFLKPIPTGSAFTITCTTEEEGHQVRVFFSVTADQATAQATKGSVLLEPRGPYPAVEIGGGPESVVPGGIQEAELFMEDLAPGHSGQLPFRWSPQQLDAYDRLLAAAANGLPGSRPYRAFNLDVLGQLAALSTLVGMVVPGRTATFQEFRLEVLTTLAEPGLAGHLNHEIKHVSPTTNTITQEVAFHAVETVMAKAKISVRVANRPFEPLSMDELAQRTSADNMRGKVAIITGASRGLGATTAKLFALHGIRVAVNYRASADLAERIVSEIKSHGGEAMAVQADVTGGEEVQRMVDAVMERWGTVDILVNNAAANFHPAAFLETPWDKVQEDLDVIVKGSYLASKAVFPIFLEKGKGSIINVSSIAAEDPPPDQVKYVVAKTALNGLTRALAVEFAPNNIRVNLVVPSFMKTDFTQGFDRIALGRMMAASPMKRLVEPHEVAEAILYLAGDRSAFVTGQKIMVTGGLPPFL